MHTINDCHICQLPITHVGKGHGIKRQSYGYCHDSCVNWIRNMVDGIFLNGHWMTHKAFLQIWDKIGLARGQIHTRAELFKNG